MPWKVKDKVNKHSFNDLQRMASLAKAATSAASAAGRALSQPAQGATSGGASSSVGDATQAGLSMAAWVLKN